MILREKGLKYFLLKTLLLWGFSNNEGDTGHYFFYELSIIRLDWGPY